MLVLQQLICFDHDSSNNLTHHVVKTCHYLEVIDLFSPPGPEVPVHPPEPGQTGVHDVWQVLQIQQRQQRVSELCTKCLIVFIYNDVGFLSKQINISNQGIQ